MVNQIRLGLILTREREGWGINPFAPKGDQFQISPSASPEILHHTVWRTWLFMAYSDERRLCYQLSTRRNVLFELGSERVKTGFWPCKLLHSYAQRLLRCGDLGESWQKNKRSSQAPPLPTRYTYAGGNGVERRQSSVQRSSGCRAAILDFCAVRKLRFRCVFLPRKSTLDGIILPFNAEWSALNKKFSFIIENERFHLEELVFSRVCKKWHPVGPTDGQHTDSRGAWTEGLAVLFQCTDDKWSTKRELCFWTLARIEITNN